MPSLTTDNLPPTWFHARLPIGRRLAAGLSLADPAVSRLHAWVDPVEADADAGVPAGWAVHDAGGRGGTFVNGEPVRRRRLRDGDVVRVGGTALTYRDLAAADGGAVGPPPAVARGDGGILFSCTCGAPLWVGEELAGKRGVCRHCRRPVTVPPGLVLVATVVEKPTATTAVGGGPRLPPCGVCHGPIAAGEDRVVCPACAIAYHAECWRENHGCSTYGCEQVNAAGGEAATGPPTTAPRPPDAEAADGGAIGSDSAGSDPVGSGRSWDLLLVAAAAAAGVVGLFSFGLPPAVVAVLGVARGLFGRPGRPGLLLAAVFLALLGTAIGLYASDLSFYDGVHIPNALRR